MELHKDRRRTVDRIDEVRSEPAVVVVTPRQTGRPGAASPSISWIRRGVALILLLGFVQACGSSPPPPARLGDGSRLVPGSPPAALTTRLEAMEPLLLPATSGDAVAQSEIEHHLREIIDLLEDPAFAGHPLPRSELRARVLFVGQGPKEARSAALLRCRELAKTAFPPADGVSSPTPAGAAAGTEASPR